MSVPSPIDNKLHADKIALERPSKHVSLIRIQRPEARNALHASMVIEIARLLDEAEADHDVRCVVITGNDEAFSAGADLKSMLGVGMAAGANNPGRVDAWRRLQKFPKPIIAAVNGYAFGAGIELAMTCDFIIAGAGAKFGQPEVCRGGVAGDGGTQRLPRNIGRGLASFMLLSGIPISAERAYEAGLVVEVCAPAKTIARALEIAEVIAQNAPLSVQYTKECIQAAVGATLENGILFERDALIRVWTTDDRQEGIKSFVEKRAPVFTGT